MILMQIVASKTSVLKEFQEWLLANKLLTNLTPLELLNTDQLNAIQRDKTWAVIQILSQLEEEKT